MAKQQNLMNRDLRVNSLRVCFMRYALPQKVPRPEIVPGAQTQLLLLIQAHNS